MAQTEKRTGFNEFQEVYPGTSIELLEQLVIDPETFAAMGKQLPWEITWTNPQEDPNYPRPRKVIQRTIPTRLNSEHERLLRKVFDGSDERHAQALREIFGERHQAWSGFTVVNKIGRPEGRVTMSILLPDGPATWADVSRIFMAENYLRAKGLVADDMDSLPTMHQKLEELAA